MPDVLDRLNINNFEAHWQRMSEEQVVLFIESSAQFGPDRAILPVLKGLDSHHFSIRTQARKTLEIIQSQIHTMLSDPGDHAHYQEGMKISAEVCSHIYSRFTSGISYEEQRTFFKMMLMLEGNGPHFAVKTMTMKLIKASLVEKILLSMDDIYRLRFIGEHFKASPALRLKFSQSIKIIIQSITDEKAVVKFYAGLFDTNQDVDPVMYNIDKALRDPELINIHYLKSDSPVMRNRGLKAMAMIMPKLPFDMMIQILNNETDTNVRLTLYKVIENSALGSYPELFYPIWDIIEKKEDSEAVHAFKAMIVSGKLPLYELLDMVKDKHPNLLGHIYNEITLLKKISFFFIQDIALHGKIYLTSHIEVNLAAAFGMIKKRPERVVKLFKYHLNRSDSEIRKGIARFIQTANQLLENEKISIVKKFKILIQKIQKTPKKQENLLNSLFTSSPEKKIKQMTQSSREAFIDFEGAPIRNIDLSNFHSPSSALYFNQSTICQCNFSKAALFNTYFRESILYAVDMSETTFESVNFNGAVLMNVNAEGAVFKNCSFQNISLYNCKFDDAKMEGASFIRATISNCTFSGTQLSGASFAYSNIAVVSFEEAALNQADFTGIQARFCRFPTHARASVSYDDIDLNARQCQLTVEDMPELDESLLAQINMLIFAEFIHYGELKFFRQNKLSQLTALDIFKPNQSDLFQMIPFLLHQNIKLKNMTQGIEPDTPCGIFDYHPETQTLDIVSRYSVGNQPSTKSESRSIEGIFTIGSIGSVAQTDDSDIDYWICIDAARINENRIKLLEKKLHCLEKYAKDYFHIQITFFIVDVNKAKKNDFGSSSTESSGSAQSILLKEEFYRTMIHVAGKVPLWAVLPTIISKAYYPSIFKVISKFPNLARYIDLGDIHTVHPGEFFGATIWQLFKSLKSPFKSVIKMALLEKSISDIKTKPLLCNQVKDEWMNSGLNLRLAQNDAYYILVQNLLSYYKNSRDKNSVELLLTCFFSKLGLSSASDIEKTAFGLRGILIEKCSRDWHYPKQKIFKVGHFSTWSYPKVASLSKTLESYMVAKYKAVNNTFDNTAKTKAMISPEDRTVLGRKVYTEISKQAGKIKKVLLVSASHTSFHGLQFKYAPSKGSGSWELLHKTGQARPDRMVKTETIEEIGAWLILNQIYEPSGAVSLIPNTTHVTADDLIKLLNALHSFFNPKVLVPVSFKQLLKKNYITHLFVSMNFYAPRLQKQIDHCTAVYMNSWGEMFAKTYTFSKPFSNRIQLMHSVMNELGIGGIPVKSVCFINGSIKQD